jgi:ubiquitin-protein ligase
MADNQSILIAARELQNLKDTDYCEVLTPFQNINDPVLLRIHIKEESKTDTKYEYSNSSDEGKNPYGGGYYLIEVLFGSQYKEVVPTVIFRTPIIHANISEKDGYICLDALNKWNVSRFLRSTIFIFNKI